VTPQERYKRTRRRLNWVPMIANGCGAVLTVIYFYNVNFEPAEVDTAPLGASVPIVALVTGLLLLIGSIVGQRREVPLWQWYRRALHKEKAGQPPPIVQRLALNLPFDTALVTLVMWVVAGFSFGLLSAAGPATFSWSIFGVSLLGISGLAGPATTILVYFATERVWRSELPLFFPRGKLSEVRGYRLSVRSRMLILFVMGTIPLLLLAVVTYSQASQIARAPSPSLLLPKLLRLEALVVGIGLIGAVALSQTLGASLVESLETLEEKMATVQSGDLDQQMDVISNDELGQVAEGFNAMVQGLAREEVIHRLFSRYVTQEVADYAIEHGATLGARLTEATVLFTDIRDFTALTERMEPAVLIALLNRYFTTISDVIIQHGGLINKFGGDSLLAIFGSPVNPGEDPPRQAVASAAAIVHALIGFNADQEARGEPTLRIGVGLATGQVLAGNVGGRDRMEYTVIGDAVNLASRLEAMTKSQGFTVLLDGTTAEAVDGAMPIEAIGQVDVRGKREPVSIHTLKMTEEE